MKLLRANAATVAFVVAFLLTIGLLLTSQAKVHQNQLDSCERGNELRRVLSNNEAVQFDFLTDAIKTRDAQATQWRKAGNEQQAKINAEAAAKYRADRARLKKVSETSCEKVVR